MFGLFLSLIRRRRAKRIADKIAPLIIAASGLAFFLKHDERDSIPKDEFVCAYIYGAISCSIAGHELRGQLETKGWIIWETFERLFPGKAANLVASCNQRIEVNDKEFKRIAASGLGEMRLVLEALNSEGQKVKTLESLRAHLDFLPSGEQ